MIPQVDSNFLRAVILKITSRPTSSTANLAASNVTIAIPASRPLLHPLPAESEFYWTVNQRVQSVEPQLAKNSILITMLLDQTL